MPRAEEIDPPEVTADEELSYEIELHERALEEAPRQAPCPASRWDVMYCGRGFRTTDTRRSA